MQSADVLEIAPDLHRVRLSGGGAHLLNAYLWLDDGGVTAIDTGAAGCTDQIAAELNGDVVLGPFTTDRAQATESLRRLAALDVDVLAFGHGEAITPAAGRLAGACDLLGGPTRLTPPQA